MAGYITRRLLRGVLTMLGVAVVVFGLLLLSGDPALIMSSPDATPDQVAQLRATLGLDRPIITQLGLYLGHVLRGDLGQSLRFNRPVAGLILERLPDTIELTLAAIVIAIAVAVPAGIVASVRRGALLDRLVMAGALAGQAIPVFWLGLILIRVFAIDLAILPVYGQGGPAHLVLPACTLATIVMGRLARLVRATMLDVLGQDYIRTARAKGLREWRVLVVHGLRNAAMPIITLLGLQLAQLLGGAVVTERVFAWPGVGSLVVEAVFNRDFPVVQGVTLVIAGIFVAANLLVDMSYALLDPRVRQ
ncbi:MAG: ABC transporter permease [Nevskiales bacterium]